MAQRLGALKYSVLLAVLLIGGALPCRGGEYFGTAHEDIKLPSGETFSKIWAVSYNRLRRGTDIEFSYTIMIGPDACFLVADDPAKNMRGVKMEVTSGPGLQTKIVKKSATYKVGAINKIGLKDCYSAVEFKTKIAAPENQALGLQKANGNITWQATSKTGILPSQTTEYEIAIEVVEHDDRAAKYNESYGYRPKADLLWRVPAFPFVLIYCAAKGGGDCPN